LQGVDFTFQSINLASQFIPTEISRGLGFIQLMILKVADIFGVTADQLMRDELELD
jgi:hypothetical protein